MYIFSGDLRYCDGARKFSAVICDGICIILDGEAKISMGNNRNKVGKVLKLKLSGESKFLGG